MTSLNVDAGDKVSVEVEDGKLRLRITDIDGGEAVAILTRREAQFINYLIQTVQYELSPKPALGPDGMPW